MDSVGSMEKSIPMTMAPPSSYNVLNMSKPSAGPYSAAGILCESRIPNLAGSGAFNLAPFAGFEEDSLLTAPYKQQRKIPKVPFKVLDAPALADDFYLNLVDWSAGNVLAVGLGSCVYLWSATTSKVTKLHDLG